MMRRAVFALAAVALGCEPTENPSSTPTGAGAESPPADAGEPAEAASTPKQGAEGLAAVEAPGPSEEPNDEPAAEGAGAGSTASASAEPLPKAIHRDVEKGCGTDLGVGSKVKGFKLPAADGQKMISPAGYRGRVLLLNFWGTWCKPCLEELPEFDRMYRRYRKHGMTLVAVATDDTPDKVLEFVDQRKLKAKMAIKGEEHAGTYGAKTFPFTFVVDHQGVIRAAYEGYEHRCLGKIEADLREQLERRAEHREGREN